MLTGGAVDCTGLLRFVALVTRKAVSRAQADRVAAEVTQAVPGVGVATCRIHPSGLVPLHGGTLRDPGELIDMDVVAVASLADPGPFVANLRALGARVALAILSALVQLGFVASIHPGPAAVSFALSVAFTMLAAQSFDPRLIWRGLPLRQLGVRIAVLGKRAPDRDRLCVVCLLPCFDAGFDVLRRCRRCPHQRHTKKNSWQPPCPHVARLPSP